MEFRRVLFRSQPKEVATPSAVHATNATTSRGAGLIAWSPNANATSSSRRGRSYCRCGYATNSLPRRLHLGQQRVQHLVGILAFDLQLRRQRDAVAQRGPGDVADVVRSEEVAAHQHRLRARCARPDEHTSALQSLKRI